MLTLLSHTSICTTPFPELLTVLSLIYSGRHIRQRRSRKTDRWKTRHSFIRQLQARKDAALIRRPARLPDDGRKGP